MARCGRCSPTYTLSWTTSLVKSREYPTKRRTSPPESSAVESFLRYKKTEVHEFEERVLVAEERKRNERAGGNHCWWTLEWCSVFKKSWKWYRIGWWWVIWLVLLRGVGRCSITDTSNCGIQWWDFINVCFFLWQYQMTENATKYIFCFYRYTVNRLSSAQQVWTPVL